MMKNYRLWGKPSYKIVVVHGGPGAPGSVAAIADELSHNRGVLEPFQTALTIDGQVEELKETLEKVATQPVTIIGHSWGAWLAFMTAAQYPALAKKLILVGSGAFTAEAAAGINEERLNRLTEKDRIEFLKVADVINDPSAPDRDKALARLGELAAKADTFCALPLKPYPAPEGLGVSEAVYQSVMPEALKLRETGALLAMGRSIVCPVVAISGDYDTHLAAGVKEPLSGVLRDFKFILLVKCGHEPWMEKYARDDFFKALRAEMQR
jgi:pimeloyl-ACP methyl ester carboxylesterase